MTEKLWPAIQQAYVWVHQAAHLLANAEQCNADTLKQNYQQLLDTMAQQQDLLGALAPAVAHFQKVTASYWDGLFHCYEVEDLPRTNNDLEQYFGTARHIERRVTGRKRASPTLVVRGSVRVVAAGPVDSSLSRLPTCGSPMSLLGMHCVRHSTIATRVVAVNCVFAAIHRFILLHWNKVSSD